MGGRSPARTERSGQLLVPRGFGIHGPATPRDERSEGVLSKETPGSDWSLAAAHERPLSLHESLTLLTEY